MQVFVIIKNVRIMINADVDAKNLLTKEYGIKNLFGIVVIEWECDKLCDVGEYLDYANCKSRKRLTDKLVEECSKNIDKKELHSNKMNDYEKIYNSFSAYIALLVIFFIISICISSVFIYFHCHLKKNNTDIVNINPSIETVIYWMQFH